ncbi:unnamed protein product, partial [Rotaria sp. Silwood1]
RWVLRIKKKTSLSRSSSQSSFQSCTEEEEHNNNDDNIEEEEEYTWKSPTVLVHNVLFGRLWCEFQGQVDLKHTQSNRRSIITIKSHSWFASQSTKTAEMFKFTGFIYDDVVKRAEEEKQGDVTKRTDETPFPIDGIESNGGELISSSQQPTTSGERIVDRAISNSIGEPTDSTT